MTEEYHRFWSLVITGVTAFAAIITVIVGINKYLGDLEKSYKSTFWENQMETCASAIAVASEISRLPEEKEIPKEKIDQLFQIYFGLGQLYLNQESMETIGDIGSQAVQCNAGNLKGSQCIQPMFNVLSMNVGVACRDMLTESWDLPLKSLNSEKLKSKFIQ